MSCRSDPPPLNTIPAPSSSCDTAVQSCPLSDLAVLVTHEMTGAPIIGADVTVIGIGAKPTNPEGKAIWEKINPGTYDIQARKNAYIPDPGEKHAFNVPASSSVMTEIKLVPLELHLHVDNDRDGIINDDWNENNKWEAGAGKKGAVILCNNDDEDSNKSMDWENDIVDTGTDVPDIAPLYIRKKPTGRSFPAGWKATISVSDKDKIRIFDQHAAGGKEIIGPNKGNKFDITDLSPNEHRFGMEGVQYPDAAFDGKVTLTLKLFDNAGTEVHSENAIVRVSPWLMFHHACKTLKVYVVATADNATFRTALTSAAGVPVQVASEATYGTDRWMQDAMEPGFSSLPKTGAPASQNLPVTLRTFNDRSSMGWGPIDTFPKQELLGPDYGFTQAANPGNGDSLDSFGNLECSPPFTHSVTGKDYKFGRIVYGSDPAREMHPKVRQFLIAQKAQEPFSIDTAWLIVGHVDEVMSFLPLPSAPKGFKVMTASPKMALEIVKRAPDTTKLLQGIQLNGVLQAKIDSEYPLQTAGAIKSDASFQGIQTTVQAKIDGIKGTLKTELGLQDSDFIDLPVLFMKQGGRYIAYTAGVVNMLVISNSPSNLVLCIPKPFGPKVGGNCKFEEEVRTQLNFPGIAIHFIDDFTTYHMLSGEIHCGTNSQRKPPEDRWWWELDWI